MSTPLVAGKSYILRPDCPECSKAAIEESHFFAFVPAVVEGKLQRVKMKFVKLKCGHTMNEKQAESVSFKDVVSETGKTLRPYQDEACHRIVKTGFKALLRIDVGLGKTIISLAMLRKYWKELTPCLIICKSSLTMNWMMEFMDWIPNKLVQVIENGKEVPTKGFKVVIVSMDLIRTVKWLDSFAPKTIIFDEIQHVKNPDATRTKIVQSLVAKAKYFLPLSGTPIKNHVGEYFNVLNMIAPKRFRVREQFLNEYVDTYHTPSGILKFGGLRRSSWDAWQYNTKDVIIDYKKDDVAKDLPKVIRDYKYYKLAKEDKDAYGREMRTWLSAYDDQENSTGQAKFEAAQMVNQSIMRMRQIVGIAKVDPTVEYVSEWLDDNDEEKLLFKSGDVSITAQPKIVIFVHHVGVGNLLQAKLDKELRDRGFAPSIRLLGGISGMESSKIEYEFKTNPKARVLIASTLASGEGKNFQFCSMAVMLERQWNPPNEEQAEGRFPRPGTTAESVMVMYPVAIGTVDEDLARLVEKKRANLKTTEGVWANFNETSIMRELFNIMATEGRKKWMN